MRWEEALLDFQHFLKIERGLSANTLQNYSRDIKKLRNFIDEKTPNSSPLTIDKDTVQAALYEIAKSVNPRSQARIISGLKSFFDYLLFEDLRKDNPMDLIEAPKIGRKLPETLSTNEIDMLIATIDLSKPEGERNRAILETLYGCGLRVSELINLRLSDLFFQEDFIRVTGKGNKQRLVPISEHNKKYLSIYIDQVRNHIPIKKGQEDFVFLNRRGSKLSRAMVFTIIKNLADAAGLKKSVSPHTFRHSFATHLLQGGADLRAIQQMLGHESITTTEVYMHLDRTDLANVITKFHPRNN